MWSLASNPFLWVWAGFRIEYSKRKIVTSQWRNLARLSLTKWSRLTLPEISYTYHVPSERVSTWYGIEGHFSLFQITPKWSVFFFFLSIHILMPVLGLNWVPTESVLPVVPQITYFLMPRKKILCIYTEKCFQCCIF